jgi:restriction endonuclease S subunit
MKITLSELADIQTGVTLREKPVPSKRITGNVLLMQLGDLDTDGNIQTQTMSPSVPQELFEKFIVKSGDLIFRGRGAGIAVTVVPELDLPIVATSPLIIIKPNTQKIDPHYLAWALTNNHARRYYAEYLRGSSIMGIGKRDLDVMGIDLPALRSQRKIGNLKKLEAQEHRLLAQLQRSKAKLVAALIGDVIDKEMQK